MWDIYRVFRRIEERSFEKDKKTSYMLAMQPYFRVIATLFLNKLCLNTSTNDVQNELAAELEILLSPLLKVLLVKY